MIDILDGIAVSARKGERANYGPLESVICNSTHPLEIAKCYLDIGFKKIYVADLDGILGSKPNLELLKEMVDETGLEIIADTGIKSVRDVKSLTDINILPILGTETLSSLEFLYELFHTDFILSIDVKGGKLLSNLGIELADFLNFLNSNKAGRKEVILLDLGAVGTYAGPNIGLCREVGEKLPEWKVIYGGGVERIADIHKLCLLGAEGVLIGSAIHSGKIGPEKLVNFLSSR